jgi:hypothetical protein
MKGVRVVSADPKTAQAPCSRCRAEGCPWDRIAGKPICPDCQEQLALGEGEALVERLQPGRCAACRMAGSVLYQTYPLHAPRPIEIDLCPRHFRALLSRRLDRPAFRRLVEQLAGLGLNVGQVFLLHEAFYDDQGRPLHPVPGP